MSISSDDWQLLAQELRARKRELRMSQAEITAWGGPSSTLWRDLIKGERRNYQDGTLDKCDRALKWESGSAERVLRGEKPRPLPGNPGGPRLPRGSYMSDAGGVIPVDEAAVARYVSSRENYSSMTESELVAFIQAKTEDLMTAATILAERRDRGEQGGNSV